MRLKAGAGGTASAGGAFGYAAEAEPGGEGCAAKACGILFFTFGGAVETGGGLSDQKNRGTAIKSQSAIAAQSRQT